ncbi:Kynurenine formamidase [Sergentomyia squamirostris]
MDNEMKILEKEFSPSEWAKRFATADETIERHKKVIMEGTNLARETLECVLDIAYDKGPRSKLDVYGMDLPDDAPVFVIFHGGYWQIEEYTKEMGTYGVIPLVRAGCRVIVVDYEMCPTVTLSELVSKIYDCINFTLCHAKIKDAKFINFIGHSAGAHLIMCQCIMARFVNLTHNYLIKDIYLLSGVYDLRDLRFTQAANKNNLLSINETNLVTLSPALYDFEHIPMEGLLSIRFTVIAAENDSPSFISMSEDMAEALKKGNAIVNYMLLPNSDHFEIVEQLNDENGTLMKMMLKNLYQ